MGREWYFGGDKSTKREKKETTSTSTTPVGCMSAVFQLFDFHNFHPCFNQSHSNFIHEDSITIHKGVEAPRNSLESEEILIKVEKKHHNLNIPMGNIQIKTRIDGYSESADSPSTKSPNLVARLMGLDLLPMNHNSHSPTNSSSSSSNHNHSHLNPIPLRNSHLHNQISTSRRTCSENDVFGTRSLPETPRVSSERKSDADNYSQNPRRLSLQIIREKLIENDENENRSATTSSPRNYARQIVKQVRESVGSKVGVDITNVVKNRVSAEERRDENLLGIKLKKSTAVTTTTATSNSSSPRLRLLEQKKRNKLNLSLPFQTINNQCDLDSDVSLKYAQAEQRSIHKRSSRRSKKITAGSCLEKQVWGEEQLVRQSNKKAPLPSNDFLRPLKKCPSPTATRLPQNQAVAMGHGPKRGSQLSGNPCLTFKQQKVTHTPKKDTQSDGRSDIEYVTKILKCNGIENHTNAWFSPSHPLDPASFNDLESAFYYAQLNRRSTRRLIFNSVDEILVDILRPYIDVKPWVVRGSVVHDLKGSHNLIENLCARITSYYPGSNCENLQDIDAIIEKDYLREPKAPVEFEEGESIVKEIEKEITESLVHETLVLLYG